MKIKIALEQVFYGLSTPAESRKRGAGLTAPVPAVARKAAGARAGDVGAEAEALANEKLVQAGRRADVAISGRGPMLQRRGLGMRPAEPPPALAERVTAYLSRQYEGPRRLRLPVTSTAELASAVRAAVPGAELLADAALHRIIDVWRDERRLGAAGKPDAGTGAPAGGASGLPPLPGPAPSRPSPLGTRLSDLGRFLSRIPTSVALGDPDSLEFRAGKEGLRLAHERPGLKLAATMGWDRTLAAQARHGDLSFAASADVLGGEQQALTFGLRYGPSAPDLARLPAKMTRAGQGVGDAAVHLPRFVSFLRDGGVEELGAIPDAVEQARRIAGERERRVPISLGLTASVSREGEGPPGVSVMGNLTLAWDVLKKAKPGAAPPAPGSAPPPGVAIPRGGGQPLDANVHQKLEGLFGRQLPDVRIHTEPAAAATAAQLGAEAFTIGRDIFFGTGKYSPASQQGLGLLAHEVTHVLQQERGLRNGVQRAGGGDIGGLESEAKRRARVVAAASNGQRNGSLSIGEYRPSFRSADGQELTDAEQLILARIAARGRQVCEQILRAEYPGALAADRALPRLSMKLDVDLDRVDAERAAQAWGRKMAETIVGAIQAVESRRSLASAPSGAPQLSPNGQAPAARAAVVAAASAAAATPVGPVPPAVPGVAPGVATPLRRPVDPPEVFDRLKTEAKEDALKIKQFLHPNLKGAPIWEMGKRVEQGKNATWDIIAKWAAKSPDAGYQGRGGYMTPFEIFIDYLQMQTFTVSEWGVDQWTNSFELIFDRMSDSRVAQFKTWIKNLGGGSKHDKPFGMVHFDVGKVLKEAGEVYVELGGAFLTGGASIVAKIADWLINKLPKLLAEAKSVYSFVQKIRDLKFDDVKKFLSPVGVGQFLAGALFGKAALLPTAGRAQDEKEEESGSSSEAGGFVALLRKVLTVINAVKKSYGKVAEAVNAALSSLDITKAKWFEPFSMAYAGVVHAAKALSNPGATLQQASQTLRGIVGGFFQKIKEKIAEIAGDVKGHLDFIGKGKNLIADLADKAVEMVVNFLVKYNPSAAVKTALRVVEAATDGTIAQLLRKKVPYGEEIFKEISESSVVRGLLSPLKRPISAVSELTEAAAGEATNVVTNLEQQALDVVADGATMVSELAGVKVPRGDASPPVADASGASAKAAGGTKGSSGFLDALKQGIHASLLELGTQALLRRGKRFGKAAVEKSVAAAKTLGGKVKGLLLAKVDFWVRGKPHELWTEERDGEIDVYVASEEKRLREKIAVYRAEFGSEEAKRIERLEELLTRVRFWKEKERRDPRFVGARLMPLNREMARIVAKLDKRLAELPPGRPRPSPKNVMTRQETAAFMRGLWNRHGILHRLAELHRSQGAERLRMAHGILSQFTHETGVQIKWVPRGGNRASVFDEPGALLIDETLEGDAAVLGNEVIHELCAYYAAGGGRRKDVPHLAHAVGEEARANMPVQWMIEAGGPDLYWYVLEAEAEEEED